MAIASHACLIAVCTRLNSLSSVKVADVIDCWCQWPAEIDYCCCLSCSCLCNAIIITRLQCASHRKLLMLCMEALCRAHLTIMTECSCMSEMQQINLSICGHMYVHQLCLIDSLHESAYTSPIESIIYTSMWQWSASQLTGHSGVMNNLQQMVGCLFVKMNAASSAPPVANNASILTPVCMYVCMSVCMYVCIRVVCVCKECEI